MTSFGTPIGGIGIRSLHKIKVMAFRFRPAERKDLDRNPHLREPDRPVYSPAIFQRLPDLLETLLSQRRVRMVVVEDDDRNCRARMLAGCSFVHPDSLAEALDSPEYGLLNALFKMALAGRCPFLAPKQIARANADGTLVAVDFLGVPDLATEPRLQKEADAAVFRTINAARHFYMSGYRVTEIWQEYSNTMARNFLQAAGFGIVRERPSGQDEPITLYRFRPKEALDSLGSAAALMSWTASPRLGLSLAEQELLELALLGYEDPEISARLTLSEDAVKKRWRAIYRRVTDAEPNLVPADATGHVRRRVLLGALQGRLEEIRPYPITRSRAAKLTLGG